MSDLDWLKFGGTMIALKFKPLQKPMGFFALYTNKLSCTDGQSRKDALLISQILDVRSQAMYLSCSTLQVPMAMNFKSDF